MAEQITRTPEQWGLIAEGLQGCPRGERFVWLDNMAIDPDHDGNAGQFLGLLGINGGRWIALATLGDGVILRWSSRKDPGVPRHEVRAATVGRACIAMAEMLGGWPGSR